MSISTLHTRRNRYKRVSGVEQVFNAYSRNVERIDNPKNGGKGMDLPIRQLMSHEVSEHRVAQSELKSLYSRTLKTGSRKVLHVISSVNSCWYE